MSVNLRKKFWRLQITQKVNHFQQISALAYKIVLGQKSVKKSSLFGRFEDTLISFEIN